MPTQDKTGPSGQGPMTGRGLGPCNTLGIAPNWCRGFGRGCGFRRIAFQPVELTAEQERKILEAELAGIEVEKAEIQKRLKEAK